MPFCACLLFFFLLGYWPARFSSLTVTCLTVSQRLSKYQCFYELLYGFKLLVWGGLQLLYSNLWSFPLPPYMWHAENNQRLLHMCIELRQAMVGMWRVLIGTLQNPYLCLVSEVAASLCIVPQNQMMLIWSFGQVVKTILSNFGMLRVEGNSAHCMYTSQLPVIWLETTQLKLMTQTFSDWLWLCCTVMATRTQFFVSSGMTMATGCSLRPRIK